MKKPNEIRKETTFLTDKKGYEKFSKVLSTFFTFLRYDPKENVVFI